MDSSKPRQLTGPLLRRVANSTSWMLDQELSSSTGADVYVASDGKVAVVTRGRQSGVLYPDRASLRSVLERASRADMSDRGANDWASFIRSPATVANQLWALLPIPEQMDPYSAGTLDRIDDALAILRADEHTNESLVVALGAFLGEWFIRQCGGQWRLQPFGGGRDVEPVVEDKNGFIFQPLRIRKELLEQGTGTSVAAFMASVLAVRRQPGML